MTTDGCLAKTNKTQMMHVMESEVPTAGQSLQQPSDPDPDGNALLQSMLKLPEMFGLCSVSVFNALPKHKWCILSLIRIMPEVSRLVE